MKSLATVVNLEPEPPGVRLAVAVPQFASELTIGESIAINGCCLTVVEIARELVEFQAGEETLRARTWVNCRRGMLSTSNDRCEPAIA